MSNYVSQIKTNDGWKKLKDTDGRTIIEDNQNYNNNQFSQLRALINALNFNPIAVNQASQMTDHNRIYVYTGNEAGFNRGYTYYWDIGTEAFIRGWQYQTLTDTFDNSLTNNTLPASGLSVGNVNRLATFLNTYDGATPWYEMTNNDFAVYRFNRATGISKSTEQALLMSGNINEDCLDFFEIEMKCDDPAYFIILASYKLPLYGYMGATDKDDIIHRGRLRTRVFIGKSDGTDFSSGDISQFDFSKIKYRIIFKQKRDVNSTQTVGRLGTEHFCIGNYRGTGEPLYDVDTRFMHNPIPTRLPKGCTFMTTMFEDNLQVYLRILEKTDKGWGFREVKNYNWRHAYCFWNNSTDHDQYIVAVFRYSNDRTITYDDFNNVAINIIPDCDNSEFFADINDFDRSGWFNDAGKIDFGDENLCLYTSKYYEVTDDLYVLYCYFKAKALPVFTTHTPYIKAQFYDENYNIIGNITPRAAQHINGDNFNLATEIYINKNAKYFRLCMSSYHLTSLIITNGKSGIYPQDTLSQRSITHDFFRNQADQCGIYSLSHRGLSSQYPENTMTAFIEAWKVGHSWLETDLQWTSDDKPVLLHDDTINRTSNGQGAIAEMTLAEARQYIFNKYTGETLPTLEELLVFIRYSGMKLQLELKSLLTDDQYTIMYNLIKKYGLKDRIVLSTFISRFSHNQQYIERFNQSCGYRKNSYIYDATSVPADSEHTHYIPSLNAFNAVQRAYAYNFDEIQVYTVNDSKHFRQTLPTNVNSVITNNIPLAIYPLRETIYNPTIPMATGE